jgi:hypothetical protein
VIYQIFFTVHHVLLAAAAFFFCVEVPLGFFLLRSKGDPLGFVLCLHPDRTRQVLRFHLVKPAQVAPDFIGTTANMSCDFFFLDNVVIVTL